MTDAHMVVWTFSAFVILVASLSWLLMLFLDDFFKWWDS